MYSSSIASLIPVLTALHAALGEKSHLVTIHGPMLSNFKGENFTPFTLYNFENGLTGSLPTGEIRMPEEI